MKWREESAVMRLGLGRGGLATLEGGGGGADIGEYTSASLTTGVLD